MRKFSDSGRWSAVAACAVLLASVACSDPAVRLALCMKAGSQQMVAQGASRLEVPCDVRVEGPYAVVLLPSGAVSDGELRAAGLSEKQVALVHYLELPGPPRERIFVVPSSRRPRPSRTTAQMPWVGIPSLVVDLRSESRVTLVLERSGVEPLLKEVR